MTDMSRFVGTWSLVGIDTGDGRQFGGQAKGQIIYDNAGNMSAHVVLPPEQPSAAPDGVVAPGYSGYFGTFTVDEADSVIVHHRVANTNPKAPTDVRRQFHFTPEGHLVLTPRESQGNQLTFRRISK